MDPEYIAFEILDNNSINDKSVFCLFSQGQLWVDDTEIKREYKNLQPLQSMYEKFKVVMDDNFEKRIDCLGKVTDEATFEFKAFESKGKFQSSKSSSFKKSEPTSFVDVPEVDPA
jgi:hypothetical protein